jgi:hypothetical protein
MIAEQAFEMPRGWSIRRCASAQADGSQHGVVRVTQHRRFTRVFVDVDFGLAEFFKR